jgi:hypothetical protein
MGHTACTEPQCLYKGDLYLLHTFIIRTEMIFITCVALLDIGYGYVTEFYFRVIFKFLALLLKFVMPSVA